MNEIINLLPPQTCYYLFGLKIPFYFHFFVLALFSYKPFMWVMKKKYFPWLVIFLPSLIILVKLLRNDFFFQSDDFAHLKIAAEYSFGELLVRGMGPRGVWGFHHLFTALWLFKAIFLFFKTKFEAYLLANFFLHLVNLGLFYLIVNKIKKSNLFSVLVTFVFGTFYLSWIANIHDLITTTFFLLAIFSWLSWLSLSLAKKKYLFFTLLFYLLAICSKEITFILPLILILISIFWHNYVNKVNFRKVFSTLLPFFLILAFYFLTYGKVYLDFFNLQGNGYRASFAWPVLLKNLLAYLTAVVPILNASAFGLMIFLFTIIVFDIWKRKLLLIPLFLAYLMLIAPPAFFERKIALYYAYMPSVFLFFGFFVFLYEIYSSLSKIFKKKGFALMIFNVYFVLFVLFGIFKMDKFLMDNCFLIHFPWENPHRVALNSLSQKLDKLFQENKIEEGIEIRLEEKEVTHEIKYMFTTNALYLFLEDKNAINYTFVYNEERNSLIVEARSSYHRISF